MADEKPFRIQFLESLSALVISAFGLVAALAWNETIKEAVAMFFSADDNIWGLLVYALIVTVLAVGATMLIVRATNNAKKKLGYKEE